MNAGWGQDDVIFRAMGLKWDSRSRKFQGWIGVIGWVRTIWTLGRSAAKCLLSTLRCCHCSIARVHSMQGSVSFSTSFHEASVHALMPCAEVGALIQNPAAVNEAR